MRRRVQDGLQGAKEADEILVRQSRHQVQVDGDGGILHEPPDGGKETLKVGAAGDPLQGLRFPRLDADFEPEHAGGDPLQEPEIRLRQEVGGDLEMEAAVPVGPEDEFPDRIGPLPVVVECPVHELDSFHPLCHEQPEIRRDPLRGIGAYPLLQGGEAEGAGEGAAAGGLVIDERLVQVGKPDGEGGGDGVQVGQGGPFSSGDDLLPLPIDEAGDFPGDARQCVPADRSAE